MVTRKELLFALMIVVVASMLFYFVMSSQSPKSYHLYYLHPPKLNHAVESSVHYDFSNGSTITGQQVLEPMLMSLDYGEQFSNALVCLSDLQCWANTVGITKVMEPFIQLSSASTFHFLPKSNALTLGDLIDIDAWNKMSLKRSLSTLVSLKTFLDNAVKETVFVQVKFGSFYFSCQSMGVIRKTRWYKNLSSKGFRIIDTICVDFKKEPEHCMSAESFQDKILNKTVPGHNVSVVFNIWTGIRNTKGNDDLRVCLKDSHCNDVRRAVRLEMVPSKPPNVQSNFNITRNTIFAPFIPSRRVSNCVDRFKSEFMSGGQYVAVMIRSEKLSNSIISSPQAWNKCMTTVLSDWKNVLANTTNLKTLFFTDASAHGSTTLNNKQAIRFSRELEHSLHLEHHLSEVNQYLERTSGSKNSVFIASLHRDIIARAKCVIMVGGGVFQQMTLHTFAYIHRGEELCYSFRKGTCESLFID